MERSLVVTGTTGIRTARLFVRDSAADLGFDADRLADMQLAVSELVTNALEHGRYGADVVVQTKTTPSGIDITVVSAASAHAPRRTTETVPREALHGRGLVIAEAIADSLDFELTSEQVIVRCGFLLPVAQSPHPLFSA